ncbi:hypothetical protein KC669_01635 [Candidatus Dojkabacteria bacterium]|uniref:Uncharacterized protein n=1 Tax=Candidatus Dojkabacteria bacterium TaxID=2099670 RepID=A0A955LAR1_9BACT|nr:hypothetical protein [Candidatus Dojkabacteria bacterium]
MNNFMKIPDLFLVDDNYGEDFGYMGDDIISKLLELKEVSRVKFHIASISSSSLLAETFEKEGILDWNKQGSYLDLHDRVNKLPDVPRQQAPEA